MASLLSIDLLLSLATTNQNSNAQTSCPVIFNRSTVDYPSPTKNQILCNRTADNWSADNWVAKRQSVAGQDQIRQQSGSKKHVFCLGKCLFLLRFCRPIPPTLGPTGLATTRDIPNASTSPLLSRSPSHIHLVPSAIPLCLDSIAVAVLSSPAL